MIANTHDSLPVNFGEEKGFRDLMAFLKPNHCCGANGWAVTLGSPGRSNVRLSPIDPASNLSSLHIRVV